MESIAYDQFEPIGPRGFAAVVLECVDSIPFRVGKNKVARVLKGSESKDILSMDLTSIPHYGALGTLSIAQITAIIDQLISKDYLRSSFGRRPVLFLTSQGRAAMLSGNVPELDAPDALAMFIAREKCRKCPHNPNLLHCAMQDAAVGAEHLF